MRAARGYSLVEVMVAMAVLGVGASGIYGLQTVVAKSNLHSRNLATATRIAEAWVDRLQQDSLLWNHPIDASDAVRDDRASDTRWLTNVTGQWFKPATIVDATGAVLSAGFDPFGADLQGEGAESFCVNVRLSWLLESTAAADPPYLLRGDIRVFWPRNTAHSALPCATAAAPNINEVASAADFHFLHATTAIRQNVNPLIR